GGLVDHFAGIDINLGYCIGARIGPYFGNVQLAVIVGVADRAGERGDQRIGYRYVAQAYVAFVGYGEGVADGFIYIGTAVLVLIVQDTGLNDRNGRFLAQCYNGRVVFRYAALIGQVAYDRGIRCGARGGGLVDHFAGIDINLGYCIGARIGPYFGNVQLAVIVGVADRAGDRGDQRIGYRYVAQAYVAFVGYGEGVADGFIYIGTAVLVLIVQDTGLNDRNGRFLAQCYNGRVVFRYAALIGQVAYVRGFRSGARGGGLVDHFAGI